MFSKAYGVKNFFYIQCLAFRNFGIDLTSLENTFKPPLFFIFVSISYAFFFSAHVHYLWTIRNEDLDLLTFCSLPLFQCVTVIFKTGRFVLKRKKIITLVQRLGNMTKQASKEERQLIEIENKTDLMFCGFYYTSVMLLISIIGVVPQFISLGVYLKYGYLKMYVPMKFSNPLDESQALYFFLTICWILPSLHFAGHSTSTTDTLFSGLVHNIAAQFRVLCCKFQNAAAETDPGKIEAAIRVCIQHHQNINILIDDFNSVFSFIIFVEFSLIGLQTCLLAYQVGSGIAMEYMAFVVVYMAVMLFQMLIYCYGGQRIQDESTLVFTQIYDVFPWENLRIKTRKMLLLSLVRANKCCKLSGYTFVSDWKLFVWVVRNSFSMVTLLRSIKVDNGA